MGHGNGRGVEASRPPGGYVGWSAGRLSMHFNATKGVGPVGDLGIPKTFCISKNLRGPMFWNKWLSNFLTAFTWPCHVWDDAPGSTATLCESSATSLDLGAWTWSIAWPAAVSMLRPWPKDRFKKLWPLGFRSSKWFFCKKKHGWSGVPRGKSNKKCGAIEGIEFTTITITATQFEVCLQLMPLQGIHCTYVLWGSDAWG